MGFDAVFTLTLIVLLFVFLIKNIAPPDLLFVDAPAILSLAGIITPAEAFCIAFLKTLW